MLRGQAVYGDELDHVLCMARRVFTIIYTFPPAFAERSGLISQVPVFQSLCLNLYNHVSYGVFVSEWSVWLLLLYSGHRINLQGET